MTADKAVEIRLAQGLMIDRTPKPTRRVVSIVCTYEVDRAEPMDSIAGNRRFRPTHVEIVLDNARGYPSVSHAKVKGPRVLTNGRDGVDRLGRGYYGHHSYSDPMPNWLRDLADQALMEEYEVLR